MLQICPRDSFALNFQSYSALYLSGSYTWSRNQMRVAFFLLLLENSCLLIQYFSCYVCSTGHLQHYPIEYKAVVTELLGKASVIYSKRIRQLEGEKMGFEGTHNHISEPFCYLKKAAEISNQSFQRIALDLNDHFSVPSSIEYPKGRDVGSVQDESKEPYIHISSPASISAHGVLGQFLFDVCVPKNVEDWDLKSSPSSSRVPFASTRRNSPFNPIKCIRRSRL